MRLCAISELGIPYNENKSKREAKKNKSNEREVKYVISLILNIITAMNVNR
jgi:hypothetical protein